MPDASLCAGDTAGNPRACSQTGGSEQMSEVVSRKGKQLGERGIVAWVGGGAAVRQGRGPLWW